MLSDHGQYEPGDQAVACERPMQTKPVWRSLSETGENTLSVLDVKAIIENLSAALGQKHWDLINAELERLDISKMGEDAIVAVTRTLAPASKMLPYWKCFVGKLNSSITERSLDLNVLRGIV